MMKWVYIYGNNIVHQYNKLAVFNHWTQWIALTHYNKWTVLYQHNILAVMRSLYVVAHVQKAIIIVPASGVKIYVAIGDDVLIANNVAVTATNIIFVIVTALILSRYYFSYGCVVALLKFLFTTNMAFRNLSSLTVSPTLSEISSVCIFSYTVSCFCD